MAYSREELLNIRNGSKEHFQEVTQDLINKLVNKEKLTLAESKHICLGLRSLYSTDNNAPILNAEDFSQCADFIFWSKYLLYWNDHEGWGQIFDGKNLLTKEQKTVDVKLLDDHYKEWSVKIYADKHESALLQTIANETKRSIKEIIEVSKQSGEGSNRHKYIEKALILHSKYVYYQVAEYYEELNNDEETITLCDELLVLDHFLYVHSLFGHFAEAMKFNRTGKTYHRGGTIDFRNLPKDVINILTQYASNVNCSNFNKKYIFFNLDGQDMAIWFRSMQRSVKGQGLQKYLRVQTIYPVELPEDRIKIRKMQLQKVSEQLGFYI